MTNQEHITYTQTQRLKRLIEVRLGLDIERRAGLSLVDLIRRVAEQGVEALLAALASQPDTSPTWQRLIDEITIGETYFYRDPLQLKLLRDHLILSATPVTVWSVGCATGEELYSIALMLLERGQLKSSYLLGTDISQQAIAAAQAGIYREWSFRHDDRSFLTRHFDKHPNGYQIHLAVREQVNFQQENLLYETIKRQVDLIICRNVMLYFTPEARQRAESVLYQRLNPGGWLLLGHAETLHGDRSRWVTHMFKGGVVYQKPMLADDRIQTVYTHPAISEPPAAKPQQPLTITNIEPPVYADAVHAFQTKNYDDAKQILRAILHESPAHLQASILFAALLANLGEPLNAQAQLLQVLEADPLNPEAHYLMGILEMEAGNLPDAEKALRAALYSHRAHPLAAFVLGDLLNQIGQPERARRQWQRALTLVEGLTAAAPVKDYAPYTNGELAALLKSRLPTPI